MSIHMTYHKSLNMMTIHTQYTYLFILVCTLSISFSFSECAKHCSLCYNETECYECTQGYFLTENGECQSKLNN